MTRRRSTRALWDSGIDLFDWNPRQTDDTNHSLRAGLLALAVWVAICLAVLGVLCWVIAG